MEKKDIEHLAKLSRIALTDAETNTLAKDITSILGYVGEIEKIAGKEEKEKKVGALFNVMREDGTPHESGKYTEALLKLAPLRDGQYLKVKKIIGDKA